MKQLEKELLTGNNASKKVKTWWHFLQNHLMKHRQLSMLFWSVINKFHENQYEIPSYFSFPNFSNLTSINGQNTAWKVSMNDVGHKGVATGGTHFACVHLSS